MTEELAPWDTISALEKKLFIKQTDVYGAYLAYWSSPKTKQQTEALIQCKDA